MNWKAQRQEELDFLGLTLTDHRVWNSLPPCGIEPEDDHCFYCESQSHRSENCPTLLFFCS